jgi:hypothetical protein
VIKPEAVSARAALDLHGDLPAHGDFAQPAAAAGAAALAASQPSHMKHSFRETARRYPSQVADPLQLAAVEPNALAADTAVDLDSRKFESHQGLIANRAHSCRSKPPLKCIVTDGPAGNPWEDDAIH